MRSYMGFVLNCDLSSKLENNTLLMDKLKKVQQENEELKARMDKHMELSRWKIIGELLDVLMNHGGWSFCDKKENPV